MTKNQTKFNKPFIEYQSSGYDTTQSVGGSFFRNNSMENWKPIKGFEGLYDISDFGNIRGYRKAINGKQMLFTTPQQPITPCNDKNGYKIVRLWKDKKPYSKRVHRLALETFIGECPNGMECCHKDNNKENNKLHNLTWDTHRNNQVRDGGGRSIIGKGEDNPMAKLSLLQVVKIKELAKKGLKRQSISHILNIKIDTVGRIIRGERWGHVQI